MDLGLSVLSKDVQDKNREIELNVALLLNKELFDENKISYKVYKNAEIKLLEYLNIIGK